MVTDDQPSKRTRRRRQADIFRIDLPSGWRFACNLFRPQHVMIEAPGITVLMYHQIGAATNEWERRYFVSPDSFVCQMQALAAAGYHAVTMDEFVAWIDGSRALDGKPILITFDDGYRGVIDHATPALNRLNWPYTVFIVCDRIGAEDDWNRSFNEGGRTSALLGIDDMQVMRRYGASFQSHTCSHPRLSNVADKHLADELSRSRTQLACALGCDVKYLAYPFGDFNERVVAAARIAGYRAAFSTCPGFNRPGVDRYLLRRLEVYGSDSEARLLRKVHYGTNDGTVMQVARYYLGRVKSRMATVR